MVYSICIRIRTISVMGFLMRCIWFFVFDLINLLFLKWEMGINNEKCEFAVEWLWIFLGFDVFNVGVGDFTFNDFVKFTTGFEFCGNGKKVGEDSK